MISVIKGMQQSSAVTGVWTLNAQPRDIASGGPFTFSSGPFSYPSGPGIFPTSFPTGLMGRKLAEVVAA